VPSSSSATTATELDDADKLKRQVAGRYLTADGRFEARSDEGRWYLIDLSQTDELGQEVIRGPFATLDDVRDAIPDARRASVKPITVAGGRSGRSSTAGSARRKPADAKPKAPPKPASWIDRLPASEAAEVRAQVRALEREGIADAETLVRRDREGIAPQIAQRLIEARLAALTADLPPGERAAAERLVRRAAAIVAGQGARRAARLPGWTLVETGPLPDPPNRRITLPD
jgi:hypothetical protein